MEHTRQIMEAAERLFMRYGLKSISMDDVAAEVGISKKTLYQVVPSKGELIDHIIEAHIRAETTMIEELRGGSANAIDEMLALSNLAAETVSHMSPALLFDLRKYYRRTWDKINDLHRGHLYEVVLSNIGNGQSQGLYRLDLDPPVIARLYVVQALALLEESVFPLADWDKSMLVRNQLYYHLHGVLNEQGRQYLQSRTV